MATRRRFLEGAGVSVLGALTGGACRPGGLLDPPRLGPGSGPFATPTEPGVDLVEHVLNRCTFGIRPGDREGLLSLGDSVGEAVSAWRKRQLSPEALDDRGLEHRLRAFESVFQGVGDTYEYRRRVLLEDLTRATLLRAVFSKRQLHEVMVELWTDHFNIDMSKGECAWLKVADDRDVIRRHALGRFPDLLRASALSPAMLWYLDGRMNGKASDHERPNENYARELLELHTLGIDGGYTQRDVMEVARALTGWTVRPKSGFGKGRVEFRPERHDDGEKTVLGHTLPAGLGEEDLDRVLAIVCSHPATASHIATKLCRRFIADPPPAGAVRAAAEVFGFSGGDIPATLRVVLSRPEFLAESTELRPLRTSKLKRPFHYVVSALRATDAETDVGPEVVRALVAMGHPPFQYPTPDGYPSDPEAWRGSLLWRFRLAGGLLAGEAMGTRVDVLGLLQRAGGLPALAAHFLGRLPNRNEEAALETASVRDRGGAAAAIALLLASPAFQRY
jgi:uncharacterized protein (DUF1800 family)